MDKRDAIRFQTAVDRIEVRLIMADPDMFEHADRDDAIEGPGDRPVIQQPEVHTLGQTRRLGPAARLAELFG
jgi:hypothetical protein